MLDWEGNMVAKRYREQIILADVPDDDAMVAAAQVSMIEMQRVDELLQGTEEQEDTERPAPMYQHIPKEADQVASVLADVDPLLNDVTLYEKMRGQAVLGTYKISIGSTDATSDEHLVETVTDEEETVEGNDDTSSYDEDAEWNLDECEDLDDILEGLGTNDAIDYDEIMVSAVHAASHQGVNAEHLSKIWRIDPDSAQRTIDITSQAQVHTNNPKLARNYGTGDRMLRYKKIKDHFFMDTFFATKEAGKSSRGHTCCQLFVTDKGFIYVLPMKSKADVLSAVKEFARAIGAPDAIIVMLHESRGRRRSASS